MARLGRVYEVLRAALLQRERLPVAELVERTWRTLGGDAGLGAEELSNALRYVDLLAELEAWGGEIYLRDLEPLMRTIFASRRWPGTRSS